MPRRLRIAVLLISLMLPTAWGAIRSSYVAGPVGIVLGWNGVVRQTSPITCGPAVLATLLTLRGEAGSERDIAAIADLGPLGVSLAEFARLSAEFGMPGAWFRVRNSADLEYLPTPSVVHLHGSSGHFALLLSLAGRSVHLADTERGSILLPRAAFESEWSGRLFVFDLPLGDR